MSWFLYDKNLRHERFQDSVTRISTSRVSPLNDDVSNQRQIQNSEGETLVKYYPVFHSEF